MKMLVYGPLDVGYHPLWLNYSHFVSTGHNIAITISYAVLFAKAKREGKARTTKVDRL